MGGLLSTLQRDSVAGAAAAADGSDISDDWEIVNDLSCKEDGQRLSDLTNRNYACFEFTNETRKDDVVSSGVNTEHSIN
jgi:hypothetical protein